MAANFGLTRSRKPTNFAAVRAGTTLPPPMFLRRYYPPEIDHTIPHAVIDAIQKAAETMAKYSAEAYRIESRPRRRPGKTLRPGKQTPLWNELRRQLRPHLRR